MSGVMRSPASLRSHTSTCTADTWPMAERTMNRHERSCREEDHDAESLSRRHYMPTLINGRGERQRDGPHPARILRFHGEILIC